MEIPVYLFTGFLEAGKTRFIAETMRDPAFNDGKRKYLIIQCEEGEEELDPTDYGSNVSLVTFDDERMAAALDYLVELSETRQVILFTCQKRELRYLASAHPGRYHAVTPTNRN